MNPSTRAAWVTLILLVVAAVTGQTYGEMPIWFALVLASPMVFGLAYVAGAIVDRATEYLGYESNDLVSLLITTAIFIPAILGMLFDLLPIIVVAAGVMYWRSKRAA